jgi:hypothetical protein
VIVFHQSENRQSIINGFTVQNGLGSWGSTTLNSSSQFSLFSEYDYLESNSQTSKRSFDPPDNNYSVNSQVLGGGIHIRGASPTISNNIIKNNHIIDVGGGISIFTHSGQIAANPLLIGNIIRDNVADRNGGGIGIGASLTLATFCTDNKNSIFNNVAGAGHDIFASQFNGTLEIHLNYFSHLEWYCYFLDVQRFQYVFSAEYSKLDLIDSDLYVSFDGCDFKNTGSVYSPFRTVAHAMRLIAPNKSNRNTVHVGAGTFSHSQGDFFPVQMKSYTKLIGVCPVKTVFDSEYRFSLIYGSQSSSNWTVKNISFTNAGFPNDHATVFSSIRLYNTNEILIENCHFINGVGGIYMGGTHFQSESCNINTYSSSIFRNLLFDGSRGGVIVLRIKYATFENIIVRNLKPVFFDHFVVGLPIFIVGGSRFMLRNYVSMTNILVYDNEHFYYNPLGAFPNQSFSVKHVRNSELLINNATIVGNSAISNIPENFIASVIGFFFFF